MDNKAYKAVCIDAGASEILENGQLYWIRFSDPLYVYATRLHILSDTLSDTTHFGMYQASRFQIIDDEELSVNKDSPQENYEQLSLF